MNGAAQGLSEVCEPDFDLAEGGERGVWRETGRMELDSSERQTLSGSSFTPVSERCQVISENSGRGSELPTQQWRGSEDRSEAAQRAEIQGCGP